LDNSSLFGVEMYFGKMGCCWKEKGMVDIGKVSGFVLLWTNPHSTNPWWFCMWISFGFYI